MTSGIEHGGALDKAIAHYGGAPGDWLDLSTGINPEHFPLPVLSSAVWNRLPDDGLLRETLKLARVYYGVRETAPIAAAPGTQALIQIVPTLVTPATVAVLTPTYQEHAASFAASGWQVAECARIADIPARATVAVVVNPNNPDGRLIAAKDLLRLAATLGARGGFLVVDEAFADAHPDASVAAQAPDAPLIVLKSFGKFFGLAGVRLGFALARAEIVAAMARRLGPWAVPGPALAIASNAFSGGEKLQVFRARIASRRQGLSEALARSGLKEVGGTALFSLVEHDDAHALHTLLCERHILVRKFAYAPQWLRIGLASDEAGLLRLERALADLRK